jgi:inner membrane protein
MASAISHAVAASAITAAFYRPGVSKRVWIAGIVCSMLPDLDVIGFRFGVHYGDFWGHRGFTHSLVFAALLAGAVTVAIAQVRPEIRRVSLFVYLFLATASHGLLDAMTDGGLGVAFFSPFDNGRYFLPWRPIRVSPIGISRFFTGRGFAILESEMVWIWLPSVLVVVLVTIWGKIRPGEAATSR